MEEPVDSDLSAIDDQLLDGLSFCHIVYSMFDQVRRGTDGTKRLRLRCDHTAKRLVEELLPLARYILARYHEGRRIEVRWKDGSQAFDAVLCSSGPLVDVGEVPAQVSIEITTSVCRADYLRREELESSGGSFGVKLIGRKHGIVASRPYVYSGDEIAKDLAKQIGDAIDRKASKPYPFDTVLIVNCVPDCLILPDEWQGALQIVEKSVGLCFREVFVLAAVGSHSATLYGSRSERASEACS